jgi:intein/homing endonuclease
MTERDVRLALLNTLLTTPHRDLEAIRPLHQELLATDPRMYVRLAAWYADHGSVRDHQEMFVVMLCLSRDEGHRDVGLALLRRLPPYEVARVVDFIKGYRVARRVPKHGGTTDTADTAGADEASARPGTGVRVGTTRRGTGAKRPHVETETMLVQRGLGANVPRSMRTEIARYLREREAQPERLDSAALHARTALKRLYAGLHIRPSLRAQAMLFAETPPEDSVLHAVKQIAKASDPAEQARAIVERRIPYRVAVSVIARMTPTVLAALVDAMTPQEVINNIASLKARGGFDNADVKALVEAKLAAAKTDKRVSAYKAKVAIEAAAVSGDLAEQLDAVTESQVQAKGRITRPTALLIDKCVVGSTLVCTEHGLIPISCLVPPVQAGVREVVLDLGVASRHGSAKATRLFLNGTRSVRYIRTDKGYRLGASLNHPVLCYERATATLAWREVGTLRQGDCVVLRRGTRCFGNDSSWAGYTARVPYLPSEAELHLPETMTPELARWLGYALAEGRIHHRPARIDVTNADKQIITDFSQLTASLFGVTPECANDGEQGGCSVVTIASEELLHFLQEAVGFAKNRARDCTVPLTILLSSEDTQRAFLRAYFAGDGGLMNRRAGMIAATSASERLLHTIQVMLLNFGVVSRLKATRSFARNGHRVQRDYWRLSIGGTDAVRFMQEIGFASEAKHAAVGYAVANGHTRTWSARWDAVPGLAQVVQASQRGVESKLRHAFPTVACFRGHTREDRVPTDLLPEMLQTVPSLGSVGSIREVAESRLFIDTVATIAETEEPVYDLCVPTEQSFVSNGFISHNSGSMHQALEVGRQLGAMISAICASDLYVYAFDTIAYPIERAGTTLADWERALAGIHAGGGTSCGVALEQMRKQGQRAEQLILVTDEGENSAPLFKDAYAAYAAELAVRPDVFLVKVGSAVNQLERVCTELGTAPTALEFTGDYYALTNLIPLLTRPSLRDLLMEILAYPLPERRAS